MKKLLFTLAIVLPLFGYAQITDISFTVDDIEYQIDGTDSTKIYHVTVTETLQKHRTTTITEPTVIFEIEKCRKDSVYLKTSMEALKANYLDAVNLPMDPDDIAEIRESMKSDYLKIQDQLQGILNKKAALEELVQTE